MKEMGSSPQPTPSESASTAASTPSVPEAEAEAEAKREEREKETVHRTKVIQFLGRTTPIILQNDNGPCPLLAICNILSLKNSLNMSPDISEVSQEKLLSLVAERLIDSNANSENKDTGYVQNQQQNISDAIDLLPRLTTGIDVNLKFRRIDDFEFTSECAIFDLLDIPLYHGWIIDSQDHETADTIGSKSYNTLMGELVSLEIQTMESEQKVGNEDDDVDFVAATTATLGVPSPSLSRGQSFDDPPHKARKGDIEEEAELLRILKLSEAENPNSLANGVLEDISFHKSACFENSEPIVNLKDVSEDGSEGAVKSRVLLSEDAKTLNNYHVLLNSSEAVLPKVGCSLSPTDQEIISSESNLEEFRKSGGSACGSDARTENEKVQPLSLQHVPPCYSDNFQDRLRGDEHAPNELNNGLDTDEPRSHQNDCKEIGSSSFLNTASDSTSGKIHNTDDPGASSSNIDDSEPIYEGEERILDSNALLCENQEPVYEGEVVLAEQVDSGSTDNGGLNSQERISAKQGEIIRNFLKTSASQLTVYGLFCLQARVKERELCVFFRNNHFNTMFKYEGELYILVTDQGYINQPDLVWEKLNEVNGDTVYMTGNFKEFKMDEQSSGTWGEQNTMDYLAGIDNAQENSTFNSDLQLAMALQQQELEQQQQRQKNSSPSDGSKLFTGPQVSQSDYASSSKPESPKSKERCIVM